MLFYILKLPLNGTEDSINEEFVLKCIMTPAHNEEKYIYYTLNSGVKQTFLPAKWIIVNDNFTDRTKEIVEKYSLKLVC